jgi:hypothetical protein
VEAIYDNLLSCYEMMVENRFIQNSQELDLVKSWIGDCQSLSSESNY